MSSEEKDTYLEESTSCIAKVHDNFIKSIFDDIYHIDNKTLKKKISNQTADSVPSNVKVTNVLGIPTLGCYNHKLHNQVETMIKDDPNVKSKCVSFHCMKSISYKIANY